jgi:dihydropyrimidinase
MGPARKKNEAKMGLLIRNGEIVTAGDRYVADVFCEGGRIVAIGASLDKRGPTDQVIDAAGKLLFPGFVDPHVHMELPFMGTVSCDDFFSGPASGVAGGTTCFVDFCIPGPGTSLLDGLAQWRERSAKAPVDYTFHMAITSWNDRTAAEMKEVVEKHGITSFKVFMAYKGAIMVDDHALYQVMKTAARLGAVVTVHAENGDAVFNLQKELVAAGNMGPEFHPVSRPSSVEGEATERALMMARLHGTTAYIVHMTCKESVLALERAKLAGQKCYGETCPQYLLLDDSVFTKPNFEGATYVMSPPIRPGHLGHHEALWTGISSGMLDSVGTDHCPFLMEQKRMGKDDFTKIPNGAAGIEDRLMMLYTHGVGRGHFDLQRMVALGSTNPARIFGLYPRKGTIAVGSDADIVVFDPSAEGVRGAGTHHSNADRSIFEGFKVKGMPSQVIVNGRVQFEGGKLSVEKGAGRFIERHVQAGVPHRLVATS